MSVPDFALLTNSCVRIVCLYECAKGPFTKTLHAAGGGGRNRSSSLPPPPTYHAHAGSAFEGGNKIAFDPSDIQQDAAGQAERCLNDNISYTLRGCILIELALRRSISLVLDANRRRIPIAERIIEVIDDRQTGETILDETLKMMKMQQEVEKLSINSWVDLLSGETWNVMKIGFQLKQVRERLAKVADVRTKESIVSRVVTLLTSSTAALPPAALDKEDNAFGKLAYEDREAAFQRCDEILGEFICWPFGTGGINSGAPSVPATAAGRRRQATRMASGGGGVEVSGREVVLGLLQEVRKETVGGEDDVGFELIAGVLEVLSKLDSLI
ncbi:GPP34-domain-containing protein [Phlegmacium glaucopus]|nr:GPP34-domain-containing protein [Phlegmacium glaucopus]